MRSSRCRSPPAAPSLAGATRAAARTAAAAQEYARAAAPPPNQTVSTTTDATGQRGRSPACSTVWRERPAAAGSAVLCSAAPSWGRGCVPSLLGNPQPPARVESLMRVGGRTLQQAGQKWRGACCISAMHQCTTAAGPRPPRCICWCCSPAALHHPQPAATGTSCRRQVDGGTPFRVIAVPRLCTTPLCRPRGTPLPHSGFHMRAAAAGHSACVPARLQLTCLFDKWFDVCDCRRALPGHLRAKGSARTCTAHTFLQAHSGPSTACLSSRAFQTAAVCRRPR